MKKLTCGVHNVAANRKKTVLKGYILAFTSVVIEQLRILICDAFEIGKESGYA
jgi:hypothetical protein